MELKIKVYDYICELSCFTINGISADSDEFVDKYDTDMDDAEDYCCGDMRATPISPKEEVLTKYSISLTEYNEISEDVAEKLSFGGCGLCS